MTAAENTLLNDTLHARRLRTRYLVSKEHPNPEMVRHKMDDVITGYLKDALARVFNSAQGSSADVLWFIRKLDVNFSLNASWDPDTVARVWAESIAEAVYTVQQSGGAAEIVMRFDNRASYIGQFLADLAADSAWGKWYYESLSGVKMLSVSSAIRTVIGREPEAAFKGIATLEPASKSHIIERLTASDAGALLGSLTDNSDGQDVLEYVWKRVIEEGYTTKGWQSDQISVAVIADRVGSGYDPQYSSVRQAVKGIIRLVRIAQAGDINEPLIRDGILRDSAADIYKALSPEEVADILPLTGSDKQIIRKVIDDIFGDRPRAHIVSKNDDVETYSTVFGGVFLLLPLIDTLRLESVADGWEGSSNCDAVTLLRFVVLARCMGGHSLPSLLLDSSIRTVMGLSDEVTMKSLLSWCNSLSLGQKRELVRRIVTYLRDHDIRSGRFDRDYLTFDFIQKESPGNMRSLGLAAYAVLSMFAKRLPGFATSSFPHLHRNFLSCQATMEVSTSRYSVTLSRPPLDVILNMTGMSRTTYQLTWFSKNISVFPASA